MFYPLKLENTVTLY